MKNLFINLIFFCIPLLIFGQREGTEVVIVKKAVQLAAKENKIVVIEFWAPSCGPCVKLKRDIFENEKNEEFLNKNFVIVKVSPADTIYKSLFKYYYGMYQSTIVYIDKKGNEIDRTVSYDGDKESYLDFMKNVVEGKNLYKDVFENYQKDTLNALSNYLLANKLFFRYQGNEACRFFNQVLLYDKENKYGLHAECSFRIAENEIIQTDKTDKMQEYVGLYAKNDFVARAYVYLIADLQNKSDTLKCLAMCKDACSKYPENPDVLNKYAWSICLFKIKKDYTKALDMEQKAIQIHPNFANYRSTQAWLYYELGDKEKAIRSMKKAIELYPHPSYKADLEKFMKS